MAGPGGPATPVLSGRLSISLSIDQPIAAAAVEPEVIDVVEESIVRFKVLTDELTAGRTK